MKIRYCDNISWQDINGKIYIIEEISYKIHLLESVARSFWLFINQNDNLNDNIQYLYNIYNVPIETIRQDINELIDDLIYENLICKEVNN